MIQFVPVPVQCFDGSGYLVSPLSAPPPFATDWDWYQCGASAAGCFSTDSAGGALGEQSDESPPASAQVPYDTVLGPLLQSVPAATSASPLPAMDCAAPSTCYCDDPFCPCSALPAAPLAGKDTWPKHAYVSLFL